MLQPHHLQRETAIQSQITDNDKLKGIVEDCDDIFFFFKHLFMFNIHRHSLMYSTAVRTVIFAKISRH